MPETKDGGWILDDHSYSLDYYRQRAKELFPPDHPFNQERHPNEQTKTRETPAPNK
jgi:hypothetical protein